MKILNEQELYHVLGGIGTGNPSGPPPVDPPPPPEGNQITIVEILSSDGG